MCVNRRSGRGYIHDGNHRVAACKGLQLLWIPLFITYKGCMYDNGDELRFPEVPIIFLENEWPEFPTPSSLGFKTRPLIK